MREFTKSVLSLSWAMSLLGLKQVTSLFAPGSNTTASFDAVTRCTEDQLGPAIRSTFRSGDTLQRGLVDLTFAFLSFGLWQPNRGRGDSGRGLWGQGGAGGGDKDRSDAGQQCGWGQGGASQQSGRTAAGVGQQSSGTPGGTVQQGGGTQGGAGQPGGWN